MRHHQLGLLFAIALLFVQAACDTPSAVKGGGGPSPGAIRTNAPSTQDYETLAPIAPTTIPQPAVTPTTALPEFSSHQNSYYGYEITYPTWWLSETNKWPFQPTQIVSGHDYGSMVLDVFDNSDHLALADWVQEYAPCKLPDGPLVGDIVFRSNKLHPSFQ